MTAAAIIRAARRTGRPVLLDTFCKAGGAGAGYHRAGFAVVGVDHEAQRRYPFGFVQVDALTAIAELGPLCDAIHASPPCQRYSQGTAGFASRRGRTSAAARERHPDLLPATRAALRAAGRPYIIENVPGAPLQSPALLCGTMFGLRVYRHRLFESSELLYAPPHPAHVERCIPVFARERAAAGGPGALWTSGRFVTVCGASFRLAPARVAMGIEWMTSRELNQAIPPAYTEWLGAQLMWSMQEVAA